MILRAQDIHFSYGKLPVLRGISMGVRPGTVTGIIGPNGAGKSTLLGILSGALEPERGSVLLDDIPIKSVPANARARRIGVVPQESHIPFPFTALEIVLMGRAPYLPAFGFESHRDVEISMNAMELTDCAHLAKRSISELSGGERRRVIIARALAQEPAILLLDEPMSFLDMGHSTQLTHLLRQRARRDGIAVVAVVHDINLAAAFCDQIIVLKAGVITASGSPLEIVTPEQIGSAFGVAVSTGIDQKTGTPYCVPSLIA